MCSSKPRIPSNSTPPAPNAPEASPDAPQIGGRQQFLRGRGMTINKPDLSGLGNQDVGEAVSRLVIGAGANIAQTPVEAAKAQLVAEQIKANPPKKPSLINKYR